ncbi:MAG: transporter substrate-binding domain-containing protein [Clostridia bacterium]|nr:transporter substrate-binding domain-containing protein [Clostridia bacterium]
MTRRLISLLTALLLLTTAAAGFADGDRLAELQARGSITIATEGEWAPWTYHDAETEDLVGFDVEIARAVAEKIGLEPDFIEGVWEGLLMGLDNGMYDIMANGVEITPEREEKYDFSAPYAYLNTVLIVRGDNDGINAFEDLNGRVTANSGGSTYEQIASSYGADTRLVSTLAQTMEEVLNGRVDATLNAELSFYDFMKEHPDANLKIAAISAEPSLVAFPLLKGEDNATLLAALNDAIEALREDGTLTAISEKYFGIDITVAPEAE